MIDLLGGRRAADPDQARRVKGWVVEAFGLDEGVSVMVTEVRRAELGCPPLETMVVLGLPGGARAGKNPSALDDVMADDIAQLADQFRWADDR